MSMQMIGIHRRGFSLIELMVTVAIIGILAAVAYPTYLEHLRRSQRSQAISVMQENAQFLERNFTEANRYDQNSANNAISIPFLTSPKEGRATYQISLVAVSASAFTLSAEPVADTIAASDPCGTLTLNNLSQKTVSGSSSVVSVASCWDR